MSRMPSKLPAGFMPVGETVIKSSLPAGFNLVDENTVIPVQNSHPLATKILNLASKGLSPLGQNPIAKYVPGMAAGLSTGAENVYNNLAGLSNRFINTKLPIVNTNLYKTFGVPQSDQQGFGNFLNKTAQYAPLMFAPELAPEEGAGIVAKAISPIGNIANQAAGGALLSQNPVESGKVFGGIQAGIESVSPAVRLALAPLHGAANLINPVNSAKSFGEGLRNEVNKVKGQEQMLYAPMHAMGNQILTDNPESLFDPEDRKLFPLKIRRKLNTFLDNPTIENGHQLQSDMFTVGNKINPLTYGDEDIKNALDDSRKPILNAISNKLNSLEPMAGNSYDLGRDIHRNVLQKLIPTPFFDNLANGEIDANDPNEIVKEYKKAFPTKSSVPNNFLTDGVTNLSNKIGMGKFLQYAIPMTAGAGIAHLGGAGLIGDVLGAGGGGMFARFEESPMIKNMLQNEGLHNTLQNLGRGSRNVLRYAVPSVAGNILNESPQNANK